VARGDALPAFDVQCPLLSLPRILGTAIDSIPAAHLSSGRSGPRRGLAPAARCPSRPEDRPGLGRQSGDGRRPAPVARARTILDPDRSARRDVRLAAEGPRGGRDAALGHGPARLDRRTDRLRRHRGPGRSLDLVISVDTAVVHLAGALGRPVWLLNRFDRCWRWLQGRDDSPWYPTLRQFRQSSPGDWDGVLSNIHAEIERIFEIHDPDAKRHYSPRLMNKATIKVLSGAAR
jgi:hypothetical protein